MSKSNSVGTQLTMNKKIIGSLKSIDGIEVSADHPTRRRRQHDGLQG